MLIAALTSCTKNTEMSQPKAKRHIFSLVADSADIKKAISLMSCYQQPTSYVAFMSVDYILPNNGGDSVMSDYLKPVFMFNKDYSVPYGSIIRVYASPVSFKLKVDGVIVDSSKVNNIYFNYTTK